MSLQISQSDVLSKFDRLISKKELHWMPSNPLYVTENSFEFQVRICPVLASKPSYGRPIPTDSTSAAAAVVERFADPDPDFYIADIGAHHKLILNKFCVFRPQLLLHSTALALQSENLDEADLAAAWNVLHALEEPSVVMFNCGQESGASRNHKHMQFVPYPTAEEPFQMFPDYLKDEPTGLPFTYFISRTMPQEVEGNVAATALKSVYEGLLSRARESLGTQTTMLAHNFIMNKSWMLVIPRSNARVGRVFSGSTAFVGMVWLNDEEELAAWKECGFLNGLVKLGVSHMGG